MADKTNNATQFVSKLIYMLQNDGEVIGWNSSKTQIVVKDIKIFAQSILPKYFRHNKLESFVRQLNMYDFFKVPCLEQNTLSFKHNLFYCGNEPNFFKIKRKKKNGSKQKGLDAIQQNLSYLIKQKIPDISLKNIFLDFLEFRTFTARSNRKIDALLQKLAPEMKASKFKKYSQVFNSFKTENQNLQEMSDKIEQHILEIKQLEFSQSSFISSDKVLPLIPDFKSPSYPAFFHQNFDQSELDQSNKKDQQFDFRSPSVSSQLQPFFSINRFFVLNDFKTPPCIFKQDSKGQTYQRHFSGEASYFDLDAAEQCDY